MDEDKKRYVHVKKKVRMKRFMTKIGNLSSSAEWKNLNIWTASGVKHDGRVGVN